MPAAVAQSGDVRTKVETDERQQDIEELLSDTPAPQRQELEAEKGEQIPEPPSEQPQELEAEQGEDEADANKLVPRKGLIDERKKRQALEKRLAELEELQKQFGQQQKPEQEQNAPQQDYPDPYEDPEGYRLAIVTEAKKAAFETKAVMSQELMRERHEDYDDAEAAFAAVAYQNPILAQRMVEHPNPAKFAYEQGKKFLALREIGDDPVAYRARLESEILQKYGIAHQGQAEQPAPQKPTAKAPTSLATVASAPPVRDDKGRFAPASLSQILDD